MYDQVVDNYLSPLIDKPDEIWYHEDGSIRKEQWYKDGELHREGDKPAKITYLSDGSIWEEQWFKDGNHVRTRVIR